ncbi:winged helix-turn-helix domain-containing protein, partial [Pseudomonas aeruginosa]|uniref:winged helix-turn-helix domain-containing protein n=1 Tax=Pseudomonas aeruginosa TaxID=287 RepID=UPI003CC91072
MQLDLFSHVVAAYQKNPDVELTNQQLYRAVCTTAGISPAELEVKVPIGASGQLHNLKRRQIRWAQQTLKRLRVVERVKGERGVWRLTETAKQDLHRAKSGGGSCWRSRRIWGWPSGGPARTCSSVWRFPSPCR